MPADLTPFGANRGNFEVSSAQAESLSLFPAALDLEALGEHEVRQLRTGLVVHLEIKPHRSGRQKQQRRPKRDEGAMQLTLFDGER